MKRTIALLFVFIVSGCATMTPIQMMTTEAIREANKIEGLKRTSLNEGSFKSVGKVQGVSCRRATTDPNPTKLEAMLQMQYEASWKDANAVIDVTCKRSGTDFIHNCWQSIVCKGEAVIVHNFKKNEFRGHHT